MNKKSSSSRFARYALICMVLICLFISGPQVRKARATPNYIYVDQDATGGLNNGTDWANAYLYLQDALDQTNAAGTTGYEIWVAEGVYYPDEDTGQTHHTAGDRNEAFQILYDNVQIYGGFVGTEGRRSQRDWETNLTILSGDIDKNDAHVIGVDWSEIDRLNSFHVFIVDGSTFETITHDTVLDGFVITAGGAYDTGLTGYEGTGGGLVCFAFTGECSPTLQNLRVQGNDATGLGGGLSVVTDVDGSSSLHVIQSSFIGNRGFEGGGIGMEFNSSTIWSYPVLVNLKFWNNYAIDSGGGLSITSDTGKSQPEVANGEFVSNDADSRGGGLFLHAVNSPAVNNVTLSNLTVVNNIASLGGGIANRMYLGGSLPVYIENSILWGNTASTDGDSVYNEMMGPDIDHSDVQGCGGSTSWNGNCGNDQGGNLDVNPSFVNPGIGDFRVQDTSPVINAGDQTLLPHDYVDLDEDGDTIEALPLELYLWPRVSNSEVEMGAYENRIMIKPDADFDGDGDTDISIFRPSTGYWYASGSVPVWWGAATDWPIPGDYDGDGTTDVAIWRPSNGYWYIKDPGAYTYSIEWWGFAGDIPFPADYDGDGATDFAVFRPSSGFWYVLGGDTVQWGESTDVPVPCDYDGDGATDIAVFRPSTGYWLIDGMTPFWWGAPTDIPVPGDYDGDGDCDAAIWRPSNGYWYVKHDGAYTYDIEWWGMSTDIPVPADYDGDGDTDFAVLRSSTGFWYVLDPAITEWYYSPGDFVLPIRDSNGDGDPWQ